MKDSDIRANFIRESNVGLPFANGDRQADAGGDDASQNDEELSAPTNVSQQAGDLPPEFLIFREVVFIFWTKASAAFEG